MACSQYKPAVYQTAALEPFLRPECDFASPCPLACPHGNAALRRSYRLLAPGERGRKEPLALPKPFPRKDLTWHDPITWGTGMRSSKPPLRFLECALLPRQPIPHPDNHTRYPGVACFMPTAAANGIDLSISRQGTILLSPLNSNRAGDADWRLARMRRRIYLPLWAPRLGNHECKLKGRREA
jgi:hypothetical protein